jgi:CMP-N,N'-diacetyllegionaminic acid synthase
MIKNHKVIAIITARGGSKGLPKKNIKELHGKPLIAWTIDSARKSKYLDKVIVSTDCKDISKVAMQFGAEVPFTRPLHLASDDSTSFDVLKHALEHEKLKGTYEIVVLLEPTSPLRETFDIDTALENLVASEHAKSIVGVSKAESQHPAFLYTLGSGQNLESLDNNSKKDIRRQDIGDVYFLEGSIYASWIDTLLRNKSFYHNKTIGYIVPKWKSFEVDDIIDWHTIDAMMKNKKEVKNG